MLVVDDNPLHQTIILSLLNAMGLHADIASDGEKAHELTLKKQYDLVFMDCHMPIMDGFTATRLIKNDFPELPVIALCSDVFNSERANDAGFDSYITKPVNQEELQAVCARFLSETVRLPQ